MGNITIRAEGKLPVLRFVRSFPWNIPTDRPGMWATFALLCTGFPNSGHFLEPGYWTSWASSQGWPWRGTEEPSQLAATSPHSCSLSPTPSETGEKTGEEQERKTLGQKKNREIACSSLSQAKQTWLGEVHLLSITINIQYLIWY